MVEKELRKLLCRKKTRQREKPETAVWMEGEEETPRILLAFFILLQVPREASLHFLLLGSSKRYLNALLIQPFPPS